jgi:predicted 2-oxoglutarate/Fe(II)-dependent dioxygenase YbiX
MAETIFVTEPSALLVLSGFLAAADCHRIRAAMDRGGTSPAEIFADGFVVDEETRRALEVEVADDIIDEVERAIDAVRPQVAQFFGMALSRDEGPGFLRYTRGGFYRAHRDVVPGSDELARRISIVVFLTSAGEGCEGGSLRLYSGEQVDIPPRAGTLVAFPADVPHEVLPVTDGTRDAVVDWFY